jgi:hypothetical protein
MLDSLYADGAVLTTDALAGPGVRHGFFTRLGGVSRGCYAALNCGLGSGDDWQRVRENRSRAAAWLGSTEDRLMTARQVHSPDVVVVDRPWSPESRSTADGLVTRTPGMAVGVLTADCAPVLFADAAAGVVGAAHAGWRGARAGIIEATVAAMVGLGARRDAVSAVIGPCIAQASYEVGPEFFRLFTAGEPDARRLFREALRPDHFRFDLAGYADRRLRRLGIGRIDVLACDTLTDEHRFFSYRRTTLDGGGDYGRQLSAIALLPASADRGIDG